ncbi:hypothetical protein SDC9_136292 [bioreactor metagenome]|uniref:Uncharacterized protein n=1 Tax=bioreactor metagenome TaxID=1076179 RepID=A0A645DI61_9ZZZZ
MRLREFHDVGTADVEAGVVQGCIQIIRGVDYGYRYLAACGGECGISIINSGFADILQRDVPEPLWMVAGVAGAVEVRGVRDRRQL